MLIYEYHRSSTPDYFYYKTNTNLNFGMHQHRSFECIYVTKGSINLTIEENQFEINEGYAALVFPDQIHSYTTPDFSEDRICIFSYNYVYDFYFQFKGQYSAYPIFKPSLPEDLLDMSEAKSNVYLRKSMLYRLMADFYKNCTVSDSNIESTELLGIIINYIQQNFNNDINLLTLSKALGYHYNYLSSFINDKLKTHFSKLVNSYRIDYACRLLQTTRLSVTDISSLCGFDTIRSFNRNFKAIKKTTPISFRKLSSVPSDSEHVFDI